MTYQIAREIRIRHDDGWFYQFTVDGEGSVEITPYATYGVEERKTGEPLKVHRGESFYIPKDCIDTFIAVLEELK